MNCFSRHCTFVHLPYWSSHIVRIISNLRTLKQQLIWSGQFGLDRMRMHTRLQVNIELLHFIKTNSIRVISMGNGLDIRSDTIYNFKFYTPIITLSCTILRVRDTRTPISIIDFSVNFTQRTRVMKFIMIHHSRGALR